MRIPKFWKRHEGNVQTLDGGELRVFAWGWSTTSDADAESKARERFQSMQQRVSQGLDLPKGYGYGSRPVREQILRESRATAVTSTRFSHGMRTAASS
jgi:alpha-ketoglutarate-dependent taurine dioxygenase